MAWLSDWSKRIKLTIDSWYIDENLTDFPVLLTLVSGTNSANVFNELVTVSGTKKIAITTDNGISQCYVEIERWDWVAEEANLWVKVPTIASGVDTDLYLYYDSTKSDNTYYIGDSGDAVARNVWDDNFVGVYHLNQEPLGGASYSIINSAAIANQGTPNFVETNAALNKTCDQSTAGGGPASNAVDGDTGTYEHTSLGTDEWWKVDLGAIYEVKSIKMYKRSGYGDRPNYYYIQTADDYAFTTNVVNIITENNETSSGSWKTWDEDDFGTLSARYFRVYTHTNSQYLNIAEFQVISYNLSDGKIGKSNFFNGSDDYIDLGTHSSLDSTTALTYECIFKSSSTAHTQYLITKQNQGSSIYKCELHINSTGSVASNPYQGVTNANCNTDNGLAGYYLDGEWYYAATSIDVNNSDGKNRLYIDGVLNVTSSNALTAINSQSSIPVYIGEIYNPSGSSNMFGYIDEVRISDIGRSSAWIKATYYSLWDGLVTYESEESIPTHYYDGYVTEEGSPVVRTVRLYYRNTGELIDETTSSGVGGYYYLTTTISGEHFIVAFDDDAGEDYNALILDKLLPRGIE
jgi:hypothetical protein